MIIQAYRYKAQAQGYCAKKALGRQLGKKLIALNKSYQPSTFGLLTLHHKIYKFSQRARLVQYLLVGGDSNPWS